MTLCFSMWEHSRFKYKLFFVIHVNWNAFIDCVSILIAGVGLERVRKLNRYL